MPFLTIGLFIHSFMRPSVNPLINPFPHNILHRGLLALALAAFCTIWSGHTAAKIIVRRTPALEGMQGLIMYPCVLVYAAFAMLCVY